MSRFRLREARAAALAAIGPDIPQAAATMQYRSCGCVLVSGAPSSVNAILAALPPPLRVVAFARRDASAAPVPDNVTWVSAEIVSVDGHLGAFTARARCKGQDIDCARFSTNSDGHFDLVLDLNPSPVLNVGLKPPGYHAPADAAALARAVRELRSSIGTLHRVRYVEYERQACKHHRSMPCGRCIPACPAAALGDSGDCITFDADRCSGCAMCDGACLHGALRYTGGAIEKHLERLATMIGAFVNAAGIAPRVLLHATGNTIVAADLAPDVLPFELPAGHAFRADTWLAALAQEALEVLVFAPAGMASGMRRAIERELELCRHILPAVGADAQRIRVIHETAALALEEKGAAVPRAGTWLPPAIRLGNNKRMNLLACVDHLNAEHGSSAEIIALPPGAPVGEVRIDASRCDGCSACVEACVSAALAISADQSRGLRFIESRCGQCGACVIACARHAIELAPRLLLYAPQREESRLVT